MNNTYVLSNDRLYRLEENMLWRRVTLEDYLQKETEYLSALGDDTETTKLRAALSLSKINVVPESDIKRNNVSVYGLSSGEEVNAWDNRQVTSNHFPNIFSFSVVDVPYSIINTVDRRMITEYLNAVTDGKSDEIISFFKHGLSAKRQDELALNIYGPGGDRLFNLLSVLPMAFMDEDQLQQTKSARAYAALHHGIYKQYLTGEDEKSNWSNILRICQRNAESQDDFCSSFVVCSSAENESDLVMNVEVKDSPPPHALLNSFGRKLFSLIISYPIIEEE